MPRAAHPSLRALACLAGLHAAAWAQERVREAEIGFQQYYLTNGSRRVANVSGLTLGFRQVLPQAGVLSLSLVPAASDGRFRTGDTFIELKGLPRIGYYWTLRGGDFRLSGRLLDVAFNNLYYPEITGRGVSVEATHSGRTFGFLFGTQTLQAGVRVPLRLNTPQTMTGVYLRQKAGERLLLGARLLRLSNKLEELGRSPYLAAHTTTIQSATTAAFDALYTLAGSLKWYGEAAVSAASRQGASGGHSGPVSFTTGPLLETNRFTLKANYLYQTDSFLPLLGYYLGDRRGPFGEVKLRPHSRMELYASVSDYINNVARDPRTATIRSTGKTAGASLTLPARFSLSGQLSEITLGTRESDADPWQRAKSNQLQVTLARPIQRHSLRLAAREFRQLSRLGLERQRTAEVEDVFQHRWFSFGGAVRAQRLIGLQSKTSIFVRGNAQLNLRHFSAYANIESGNDLANRTLFATNAVSTTVLGASIHLAQGWDLQAEAFRNNLIAELNPQNVFVLQGQGVFIPSILSALNQWSVYFRMTKRFSWGPPAPVSSNPAGAAIGENLLKGSVEVFVSSLTPTGRRPVEGIPVSLDGGAPVLTDANGRLWFEDVGEGARKVGLAIDQLPSDFNPGTAGETTVLLRPGKRVRVELDVVALGLVRGTVVAPAGAQVENVILKLSPAGRYTTPDTSGNFCFYNVAEGNYEIELVEKSLPPFAVMSTSAKLPVAVSAGADGGQLKFGFTIEEPKKPVRKLVLPPAFDPLNR
ncbi:MAG TPA: hypothetical protein VM120_20240 [Bryobacteraceae bacterium]|nr:hypothetical protein [Bryobacteraceae bacterium]